MRFNYLTTALFAAVSLAVDTFNGWPDDNLYDQTTAAIKSGEARYAQMLQSIKQGSADTTSAVDICTIQNEWNLQGQNNAPKSSSSVSQRLGDFVSQASLNIDGTGANYYKIEEFFPKGSKLAPGEAGSASYEMAYNPVSNTIAVVDVANALTGTDAVNRDLTTIGWSTWAQVCKDHSGDPTKLSSIVHYSCVNDPAKYVSDDIFGADLVGDASTDRTITYVFEPGNEVNNQPFYALLGLPNGTMAKNLLINFQKTLGYKQLKQIVAWHEKGSGDIMGIAYILG